MIANLLSKLSRVFHRGIVTYRHDSYWMGE